MAVTIVALVESEGSTLPFHLGCLLIPPARLFCGKMVTGTGVDSSRDISTMSGFAVVRAAIGPKPGEKPTHQGPWLLLLLPSVTSHVESYTSYTARKVFKIKARMKKC